MSDTNNIDAEIINDNAIPVITPEVLAEDDHTKLHQNVFKMVGRQLSRSARFDTFLEACERELFTQEAIRAHIEAQDYEGLRNLYAKAFNYKNRADAAVIQVLSMASKNEIIKKYLAMVVGESSIKVNATPLDDVDKKKVADAILHVQRSGLAMIHGVKKNDP